LGAFVAGASGLRSGRHIQQLSRSQHEDAAMSDPVNKLPEFIDKFILPESSSTSPAIATLGALYVAWKGDGNDNLNLIYSTDYGRTFQGKITFNETSPLAPALCAHNGKLILSWRGDGNDQLNVAQVNIQNGTILGLSNKVTLQDTSPCAPSLASLNGRLYLAWKGDGNDNFNVLLSQDDGLTFGGKWTSPETTPIAPSICGHADGCLYMAWKGDGNDNINVQRLILDPSGYINTFGSKVTIPETTDDTPAIASFDSVLFLAWKGSGNNNLNVASSTANFSFGDKIISSNTSDHAPALCAYGRILAIAWKGRGGDNLNVAQASNYNLITTGRPRYKVVSLVYAPPGTNGGKASSYVEYGTTSSTGTTTSTSHSFKDGVDVTFSLDVKAGSLLKLGGGNEFTASNTTTDTDTVDIKKTATSTIHVVGPSADGIDHDHDIFYLWLNPLIELTLDPENNVQWSLAVDGPTMDLQYVYVAWLKNPSTMPPGLATVLRNAGLTTADYQSILSLDPFASLAEELHPSIDPNRYLPTTQNFPYLPPLNATDSVPTLTDTISDTVTESQSHSIQSQYSVSMDNDASIGGDKSIVNATLKVNGTLTWTDTSTTTSTTTSTQSATASIGGPAYGYKGQTDLLVYWDCIYNSFLFAFPTVPYFHAGRVLDAQGEARAGQKVSLDVNGKTYQTYTDPNGAYRFYDGSGKTVSGTGTLVIGRESQSVTVGRQLAAAAHT
jgi:hypothetical protein